MELMSWDSGPTEGSKAICPSFGFPCWAAPVPPGPLYIWAAKRRELLTTFSLALGHTVLNTSAIPSWFYLSPHFSYCKAFQLHEPVPFSSLALFPDPWWPLGLLPNHSRGSNWNTRGVWPHQTAEWWCQSWQRYIGWNWLEHIGTWSQAAWEDTWEGTAMGCGFLRKWVVEAGASGSPSFQAHQLLYRNLNSTASPYPLD